jgi:hypothetical protein
MAELPPLPPLPTIERLPFNANLNFYDFPEFNFPNPTHQFPDFSNRGHFMQRRLHPMDLAMDRQRLYRQYLLYKNASDERMDTTGLTDEIIERIVWELNVMRIIGEAGGLYLPRLNEIRTLYGMGIKNVSLNNMEDLIRRASKQTVIDALRELGDSPNVKQTKEQLLRQLSNYVEPSQRGGFLQALALPVAEYFINNPDSELNPANRRNQMANEFSQGNFKPKKTGLLGLFGR